MGDKPDLVERRLKHIERQIALDKGAVNVSFWEVRGYSNSAEPWLNDRYSEGG